jgi:hypothetical protein
MERRDQDLEGGMTMRKRIIDAVILALMEGEAYDYDFIADTILEALYVPTEEMIQAGANAMHGDASGIDEAWGAMIFAALGKKASS